MEKANLINPNKPRVFGESDEDVAARKEMVDKIITIFSESGLSYDQAYYTLEAVNETLMYQSRFVQIQLPSEV